VKKANRLQVLKAKKGTAPRVYYVANEKLEVIYG
jgi:tetrathionate reductase subunit B